MKTVSNILAEAAQREPDMANYYDLHRALLELQDEARREIAATLELADKDALRAQLAQKLPLISFAQLPIEAERFARLAMEITQTLAEYEVELGEQPLPDDPVALMSLAQQRFAQGQVGEGQSEEPEVTTLAQAATDLALQPYLAWAAEQALPYVDQEHWKQGYCPVCGGAPDFATLDEEVGARHLLCSRCNSQWVHRRVGCPFCGTIDHTKLAYYPSDDQVYRLYVCQECRRYLKTIDLRKAKEEILLPAERVTTIAMDAAARQEGYR